MAVVENQSFNFRRVILSKMRNFFRKYSPFLFMSALVIFGFLIGGFFRGGISYRNETAVTDKQFQVWIERVSRLAVLPEDEVPQVATVTNPEVLRSQPFFAEAKMGDVVLIYSKKAVLYDPKANKVIIVAPVNQNASTQEELVPKFQGETIDVDNPEAENQF